MLDDEDHLDGHRNLDHNILQCFMLMIHISTVETYFKELEADRCSKAKQWIYRKQKAFLLLHIEYNKIFIFIIDRITACMNLSTHARTHTHTFVRTRTHTHTYTHTWRNKTPHMYFFSLMG